MKKTENIQILLLEEDDLFGLIYKRMLQRGGYTNVTTEKIDSDFIETASKNIFDIIIIDIIQFNLVSFETTIKIRVLPKYVNTPIIIISPFIGQHQLETCSQFGTIELLQKPILKDKLIKAIEKYSQNIGD